MKQKDFSIFNAAMFIIFLFAGCAFAADIDLGEGYHAPKGYLSILITNSDGTAIQNAVDHIASGGTILLSGDFTLKKTINIKKNLSIRGIGNAKLKQTIGDRVIRCQGNITLENLTITGGASTNGGGVKIDGGTVNITSCDIHGNTGVLGGGGIHSTSAQSLTLTSCDISNNTSVFAGGGISALGGVIEMTNCTIISNDAKFGQGGGLGASGSDITLNGCKINGNKTKLQGGGIALIDGAKLTAMNSTIGGVEELDSINSIIGNDAEAEGGGIYAKDSTITLTSCDIDSNNWTAGPGGGTTFNKMTGAGGGIYAKNSTITMSDTKIKMNYTHNSDCNSSYGAGLAASGTTITMNNCEIENNVCIVATLEESEMKGAGLSLWNSSKATGANIYTILLNSYNDEALWKSESGGKVFNNNEYHDSTSTYIEN